MTPEEEEELKRRQQNESDRNAALKELATDGKAREEAEETSKSPNGENEVLKEAKEIMPPEEVETRESKERASIPETRPLTTQEKIQELKDQKALADAEAELTGRAPSYLHGSDITRWYEAKERKHWDELARNRIQENGVGIGLTNKEMSMLGPTGSGRQQRSIEQVLAQRRAAVRGEQAAARELAGRERMNAVNAEAAIEAGDAKQINALELQDRKNAGMIERTQTQEQGRNERSMARNQTTREIAEGRLNAMREKNESNERIAEMKTTMQQTMQQDRTKRKEAEDRIEREWKETDRRNKAETKNRQDLEKRRAQMVQTWMQAGMTTERIRKMGEKVGWSQAETNRALGVDEKKKKERRTGFGNIG